MTFNKKYIFYGIALIVFALICFKLLPQKEVIIENLSNDSGDNLEYHKTIFVHIEGAIINSGIYELTEGTRIFELIDLAGGTTEEADISRINLASVLKDEQKIVIPFIVMEEENQTQTLSVSNKSSKTSSSNLVNINYADLKELMTLNGIGNSMGQKIIDYRDENGLFNSIEEIKNVSGIGEAKFNKIKDNITI